MGRKLLASAIMLPAFVLATIFNINSASLVSAAVDTCTWTGGGSDDNFSTALNWTGCDNGGVPEAGDTIVISNANVTDSQVLNNDLDVALAGLVVANGDDTGATFKSVFVSDLHLMDEGTISKTGTSFKLSVGIGTTYTAYADIVVDGDLNLDHWVSSNRIVASGEVRVGTGVTFDSKPTDQMTKLIIANGASASYSNQDQTENTVSYPIELNGGADRALSFYSKCIEFGSFTCGTYTPTTWTMSGDITVNALSKVVTGPLTTVYFSGSVNDQSLLTSALGSEGEFRFGTPSSSTPTEKTEITLDGDNSTEYVTVPASQVATLTGTRGSVDVVNGGLLKGTGTVAGTLRVLLGGKVSPGMSPGCLNVNTLELSGEYMFELGGTDACSGYDQIKVTSAVMLSSSSSTVSTSRWENYTPKQGQVFTLINNQGTEAVQGTFKDLAEGATFEQNGVVFKISYVGGTGNDVTLTVQNVPTVPDTGFALLTANPLISLGATLIGTGALVTLARRARN